MKEKKFKIISNDFVNPDVCLLTLLGDTSEGMVPGKFVNIKIPGRYLRRPISIHDAYAGELVLLYRIVGSGTADLSKMKPGEELDILTDLGNGFNTAKSGDKPLLIGGGIGSAPLYFLAKKLKEEGKEVSAILGFNTSHEDCVSEEFRELGVKVYITTLDGSAGTKGFPTDVIPDLDYTYTYSCGPVPMLKGIAETVTAGEASLEERMGCGFGACMGCPVKTVTGQAGVCKIGPVFGMEEIAWEKL